MAFDFGHSVSRVGFEVLKLISESYGSYNKYDERIISRVRMDSSRILIKSNQKVLINEAICVFMDKFYFRLFIRSLQSEGSNTVCFSREEDGTEFISSLTEGFF